MFYRALSTRAARLDRSRWGEARAVGAVEATEAGADAARVVADASVRAVDVALVAARAHAKAIERGFARAVGLVNARHRVVARRTPDCTAHE